jgi:hypothetical protein
MDEIASYEVKNLCGLMDAIFSEAVSDEIAKIRNEKCCDCKVDYLHFSFFHFHFSFFLCRYSAINRL